MKDSDTLMLEEIYSDMSKQRRPLAPAEFLGWQEMGNGDYMELWNLIEDIEGHPKGSTVDRRTIESKGFYLPEAPYPAEAK